MINSIKQGIINKLSEMYSGYTIYDENVPQNFVAKSFFITLVKMDYNKQLNNRFRSLLSFDIAYFSDKNAEEIKADCFEVQMNLFRSFNLIGTYRVLNKQAKITDNVLHITFDIRHSEIIDSNYIKMQGKQVNMRF